MDVLIAKTLPFYLLMLVGFFASKRLELHTETIGKLLLYVITPVVALTSIMRLRMTPEYLALPLVFFAVCVLFSVSSYALSKKFIDKPSASILAYLSSTANTGYFGLPLTEAFFGKDAVGIAMLIALGFVLYENSLGFFIASCGKHTVKDSLKRVLRLPSLYTCIIGTLASFCDFRPELILSIGDSFRGAYSVLGMMLIGIGVGNAKRLTFFKPYLCISFLYKFLFSPLVILGIVTLDAHFFQIFTPSIRPILLLQAITPLPAFGVAMAVLFQTRMTEAATTVLASTLASIVIIPLWIAIFSWMGVW